MPQSAQTSARSTFPPLAPEHDYRHSIESRPKARESMAYMMQIPDEEIFVSAYTWISAEGITGRVVSAAGPGVGPTALEYVEGVEGGAHQNFDDWSVAGMTVRHTKPLETAEVTFAGEDIRLDFTFEALHPAYAHSHTDQRTGHPPFVADDRLEQCGRAKGTLTVRGKTVEFDTWMHRDHSWGVRDWSLVQHWKWFTAETDDVSAYVFHIHGLGQTWLYGYVDRDGLTARVVDAQIDVEYDADQAQRTADFVLRDDAGRHTVIHAETYAFVPFQVDPKAYLHEAGMHATIDDQRGVGHLGIAWPIDYLDSLRTARQSATAPN